jgi:hypothetical protein
LWRVFWVRVSRTVSLGWLWIFILLISPSWVARITGVSHQHPASITFLLACIRLPKQAFHYDTSKCHMSLLNACDIPWFCCDPLCCVGSTWGSMQSGPTCHGCSSSDEIQPPF